MLKKRTPMNLGNKSRRSNSRKIKSKTSLQTAQVNSLTLNKKTLKQKMEKIKPRGRKEKTGLGRRKKESRCT